MCGLLIEVDGDRVGRIRADPDDPLSRGALCPKAIGLKELHEDPDRLRTPLRRTPGGDFEPIGWEEALDEAARRIAEIQRRDGPDAAGLYLGNPGAHNFGVVMYIAALTRALGSRNRYAASSLDQNPKHASSILLTGNFLSIPIPDVDRTDFLLMLGANPLVSNGSLMSAPGFRRRLRALADRGGRLVVVDPRRTETAELADDYISIEPGRDPLLLAALIHTVFEENLGRDSHLEDRIDHRALLREAVARFAPERVADDLGLPAERIRSLARAFATAPTAVCYARIGTCVSPVRHADELARRRAEPRHRQSRSSRRSDAALPGRGCGRRGGLAGRAGTNGDSPNPRARRPGVQRRTSRRLPGRGDPGAGRRTAPRAGDRRGQPLSVRARRRFARPRVRVARALRGDRLLPERVDETRPPHPAPDGLARARQPRGALPRLRGAGHGEVLARRRSAVARAAGRLVDPVAAGAQDRRASDDESAPALAVARGTKTRARAQTPARLDDPCRVLRRRLSTVENRAPAAGSGGAAQRRGSRTAEAPSRRAALRAGSPDRSPTGGDARRARATRAGTRRDLARRWRAIADWSPRRTHQQLLVPQPPSRSQRPRSLHVAHASGGRRDTGARGRQARPDRERGRARRCRASDQRRDPARRRQPSARVGTWRARHSTTPWHASTPA